MTSAEVLKISLSLYSQSVIFGHQITDANKCKTRTDFGRFIKYKNSSRQNRGKVVTLSENILNVHLKFLSAAFV
jgi:hypothetical protein